MMSHGAGRSQRDVLSSELWGNWLDSKSCCHFYIMQVQLHLRQVETRLSQENLGHIAEAGSDEETRKWLNFVRDNKTFICLSQT